MARLVFVTASVATMEARALQSENAYFTVGFFPSRDSLSNACNELIAIKRDGKNLSS